MYLKHLSLTNFRNFARLDVDIPRRAVLLVGDNAQGKTNLLEAVYFLATFTSFQAHAERQLINFIAAREPLAVARLVADYQRGQTQHRLEARLILEPTGVNGQRPSTGPSTGSGRRSGQRPSTGPSTGSGRRSGQRLRKEVLLDGVKRQAVEVIGHFNAVLFVPQMSQIIEGPPEERRRYLNMALAQALPAYARVLSEYGQALSQRNALLKMLGERGGDAGQLDVWDETLSRLGAQIILWRIQAIDDLERQAARIHHRLTRTAEVLRLAYRPSYDPLANPQGQFALPLETPLDRSGLELEDIRQGYVQRLRQLRSEEIARGVTTIGPHRDELRLLSNGIDLGHYGSRGQVRTALLSLKLAEVEWMKESTGQWPIILLDETMAELDLQRRADLLEVINDSEQTLLTATDIKMFAADFVKAARVWRVREGTVSDETQ